MTMKNSGAEELQSKIKETLNGLISHTLSKSEAVSAYNKYVDEYRNLLRLTPPGERSHIRGLLYLHNIHNMAKVTVVYEHDESRRLKFIAGDGGLLPSIDDNEGWNGALSATGRIGSLDLGDAAKGLNCYHYSFRSGPRRFTVMTLTGSVYFELNRFASLCKMIEDAAIHVLKAAAPSGRDRVRELVETLRSIVSVLPGTPVLLLYSIKRAEHVLAHVAYFDLIRMHDMIRSYLESSFPGAVSVVPLTIFRYAVIGEDFEKPVTTLTFRGMIVPLAVRRYEIDDPSILYKVLWET